MGMLSCLCRVRLKALVKTNCVEWESPLCAVITINEQRNCFGPRAGQNLGGKTKLNAGRKKGEERCHGSAAEIDVC